MSPIQPPPQACLEEAAAGVTLLLERERQYGKQTLQALGFVQASGDYGSPDKAATASTIPVVSLSNSPGSCGIGLTSTNRNSNSNSNNVKEKSSKSNNNGGRLCMSLRPESGNSERKAPTQVRRARGVEKRDVTGLRSCQGGGGVYICCLSLFFDH